MLEGWYLCKTCTCCGKCISIIRYRESHDAVHAVEHATAAVHPEALDFGLQRIVGSICVTSCCWRSGSCHKAVFVQIDTAKSNPGDHLRGRVLALCGPAPGGGRRAAALRCRRLAGRLLRARATGWPAGGRLALAGAAALVARSHLHEIVACCCWHRCTTREGGPAAPPLLGRRQHPASSTSSCDPVPCAVMNDQCNGVCPGAGRCGPGGDVPRVGAPG